MRENRSNLALFNEIAELLSGARNDTRGKRGQAPFAGEFVNQVNPHSGWLSDVTVTSDATTKTYDVNLQWSNESQGFEITEIVQK